MRERKERKKKRQFEDETVIIRSEEVESLVTILIDAYPDRIQTGVSTNIGKRNHQQDAAMVENDYAYTDTSKMIAILCDGMGGLAGGEIASNLCANTLYKEFHEVDVTDNVAGFYKAAIQKVDRLVKELEDADHKPLGAGTTLASIIVIKDKLYWASVGDSRIYLIRDNEIAQITIDHNYSLILDQKVREGSITKEEADSHPKREALISFIGMGGVRHIDLNPNPFQLRNEDYIMICSDGLYRSLSEEEMKDVIVNTQQNVTATADALVNRAIQKRFKNQDNTTVVLVQYFDSA